MPKYSTLFTGCLLLFITLCEAHAAAPAPNGIHLPDGYENWRVISVSHRTDNQTLRVILGNDTAIEAARRAEHTPWPNGTILAKLVWKAVKDTHWPTAVVPGEFVHAEFMIKDSTRYSKTAGWGWARWLGQSQEPFGKSADFVDGCVACHTPVKQNDYVFTRPAALISRFMVQPVTNISEPAKTPDLAMTPP